MNTKEWEDLMISKLEGQSSNVENEKLERAIASSHNLREMWLSYQSIFEGFNDAAIDLPSACVKNKFDKFIEEQINMQNDSQNNISNRVVRLWNWRKMAGVAAILITVLGFWKMYDQNQDIESSMAHIEKILNNQSPTERIRGIRVTYNHDKSEIDNSMVEVLINVLNEDPSSNVRLAAVETLLDFIDKEIVRESLIKALSEEKDGTVKLAILSNLGHTNDQKVIEILDKLVKDESQEKFILDEAHMQLIRMDKIEI